MVSLQFGNSNTLKIGADRSTTSIKPLLGVGPAGADGASGIVGIFRGAWSSVTAYVVADIVTSGGSSWFAKAPSTNVTPVEGVSWTVVAEKGATGSAGSNGTNGTNGTNGAAGRGISTVVRTSGTGAPGTTDTYTITYSDATTSTFSVYNGANGAGSGDALVANPLSQFAATSSAQLKATISDETGSGALVFATSPALTTPTGIVKADVGLSNVDNTSDAGKPVSTAQQTALDLKSNVSLSINAQTGTTYTFVLADADKLVTLTNASPITATVPLNSSVAYPVGTMMFLLPRGAGVVTVAATGGVTIEKDTGLKLTKDSIAVLTKLATDTWNLTGKLAA